MRSHSKAILALLVIGWASGAVHAAGDVQTGQAKSATCAACHGTDGNSPVAAYPKLAGQHASYIVKQLQEYKSGVRKNEIMSGMVAALSEQDMEDLAAYFSAQALKVGSANPKTVSTGQRLYRGGNSESGIPACMACHGPAGTGNGPAIFPRVGGQHAGYTVAQLDAFREGRRANDPKRMMRDVAARMTPDEIQAVSEYLSGLYFAASAAEP